MCVCVCLIVVSFVSESFGPKMKVKLLGKHSSYHRATLCILIGEFNLFIFKVISDSYGLKLPVCSGFLVTL